MAGLSQVISKNSEIQSQKNTSNSLKEHMPDGRKSYVAGNGFGF